jgi:hypothetical protein
MMVIRRCEPDLPWRGLLARRVGHPDCAGPVHGVYRSRYRKR